MFNPKSTIYQTGWLDLVFANRNKTYGAYELRQNYNRRLGRALCITSFFVVAIFSYPLVKQYFFKTEVLNPVKENTTETVVDLSSLPPLPEKKEPPAPPASSPKTEPLKLKTTRYVEPMVVSTPVIEEPPTHVDLVNSVISTQNIEGEATAKNVNPIETGSGKGDGVALSNGGSNGEAPVPAGLLEQYPEFPGGMDAFSRFLRKHLRYPDRAVEAEVAGKVFVSFIIEKDGRLTDIKVLKGIGYGCDEEATRVLKKSPAWKPGIQNNREVRVLYTIPLVFQMAE